MDILSKEQLVYDEAVAALKAADELENEQNKYRNSHRSFRLSPDRDRVWKEKIKQLESAKIDIVAYGKLVDEYGKLLNQMRRIYTATEKVGYSLETLNVYEPAADYTFYDNITGTYNQKYLMENFEKLLQNIANPGDCISVIILQPDYFDEYCKIYGTDEGNNILRIVAESLNSSLYRSSDFIARLHEGGNTSKFVLILPHTKKEGARLVAGRILNVLSKITPVNTASLASDYLTVSMGVVTGTRGKTEWTVNEFLSCAESALHSAQLHGGNRFIYQGL